MTIFYQSKHTTSYIEPLRFSIIKPRLSLNPASSDRESDSARKARAFYCRRNNENVEPVSSAGAPGGPEAFVTGPFRNFVTVDGVSSVCVCTHVTTAERQSEAGV